VAERATGLARVVRVLRSEFGGIQWRYLAVRLLLWPVPVHSGGRLRSLALRCAGFRIGGGTLFADLPRFPGGQLYLPNLAIGAGCWFNVGCTFDLGAAITIGDNVLVGHEVLVLTTTHGVGLRARRGSDGISLPVSIGDGCWLGARCMILPGVAVGAGAVVAAGAVVTEDVPANSMVAGVPARVMKTLP
jgi:maltose O-acetyltransferase